jgi:hypothetical protein
VKPASTQLAPTPSGRLSVGELLMGEPWSCAAAEASAPAEACPATVPGLLPSVDLRDPRTRRARPWELARACTLLAAGVALLPTPAPGIVLILWGLKGLGRGVHWARRIEVPLRRRLRRTRVGRLAMSSGRS